MSGQRVAREHSHDRSHEGDHPGDHGHDHDHPHEHAHDHPHDHPLDARADPGAAPAPTSAEAKAASKLPWVLALTFCFFVLELSASRYARSEALRADAIHLLADVLAIGIAYAAFRLADRRPSARFTFGLRRIEAVAALLNAVLVLLGAAEIVHEGVLSLRVGAEPRTSVMLVVAGAALFVHGLNAALLHRDLHGHHGEGGAHVHHASPHVHLTPSTSAGPTGAGGKGRPHRMSIRGAWLHVLGDALGALGALCAGAAIRFGAPRSVDPIASFFVAGLLLVGGLRLVREAALVLLEAAPVHLPIQDLERAVCEIEGVDCVHRLRVWSLGTGYDAVAMHVMASDEAHVGLAAKVEERLRARFHVDYVCVQVDPPGTHAHPEQARP